MLCGNWTIQMALLMGSIYVNFVYLPNFTNTKTIVYYDSVAALNLCMAFHTLALIVDAVGDYIQHQHSMLHRTLYVWLLLLEIYTLSRVGYVAYLVRAVDFDPVLKYNILIYFFCELLVFPAYIGANTFFLFFRSLKKHNMKAEFEIPSHMRV